MENSEFFKMLVQVHQTTGRIEENQRNYKEYLDAVNENQKETEKKLDDHIENIEAHGEKARSGVWALVGKILAALIAAIPIIWWLFKLVQGSSVHP